MIDAASRTIYPQCGPRRRQGAGATLAGLLAVVLVFGAMTGCGRDESAEDDQDQQDQALSEAAEQVEHLGQRFARASREQEQDPELLADAAELAQAHPEYMPAQRLYGQVLLYEGQLEQAVAQFEVALELEPDEPEMHNLIAGLAMRMDEYERAERHYAEAVELAPEDGRHRVYLGVAQLEQQQYDRARHTLLEALQMDSGLHAAHAALAELYARQGSNSLALEQIRRAIELVEDSQDPQDAQRHINYVRRRAGLLRRDNQPEAAIMVLRELPARAQFRMDVAEDIATTWAMLGEHAQAGEHYEAALYYDQDNDDAAAYSAHWFLEAGEPERARELVQRLRQINPEHPALDELESRLAG